MTSDGSPSRHASAWDSPGFLMWHATLRWQRTMRACLEPLGLTHVQFVLLASAYWTGVTSGPPTQRELAAHSGLDVMMTSQVTRALERAGRVARQRDARDARARRVVVTAAGAALAVRALAAVEAADDAFFAATADGPFVDRLRVLAGAPTGAAEGPPPPA